MWHRRKLWAALGVSLGWVAACGGGQDSAPPAKSPEATFGSQPGAPPAEPSGGSFDVEESAGVEGEASPQSAPSPPPADGASEPKAVQKKESADDRPGLATQWGETMTSKITTVPFVRGDTEQPFAMVSLFYNDEQGARAMANASGFRRVSDGTTRGPGGVVTVGLRSDDGRFMSGYEASSKSYVIGEAGQRYTIVVRNNAPQRVEAVISVDGLDVLDGKPASFRKRGYLIDAGGELAIDGFRQSTDTVAAFRFGSVRDSYAGKKHGDTRNVGVIGVAVFHERGANPHPWMAGDADQRNNANPFPGQFATPP